MERSHSTNLTLSEIQHGRRTHYAQEQAQRSSDDPRKVFDVFNECRNLCLVIIPLRLERSTMDVFKSMSLIQ